MKVYFIADIGSNHDGSLVRAKKLMKLAKECGADAVKFQNFRHNKIVSKEGFDRLKCNLSHQSKWKKPIVQVYKEASISWEWSPLLKKYADNIGIEYFSSPYDLESVDMLDKYCNMFKIGSGDINWTDMLIKVAKKKKPIFIGTGASSISDVRLAIKTLTKINKKIVLMQCNTNYTGSEYNFHYLNLRVLNTYRKEFQNVRLGFSDHTRGHTAVLGAIALGATYIEKHFTDDNSREGADHSFAMNPEEWKEMVRQSRLLEQALGDGIKRVESNEKETFIVQRRCLRATKNISAGRVIKKDMIYPLRPAPIGSIPPNMSDYILKSRHKTKKYMKKGEEFYWDSV